MCIHRSACTPPRLASSVSPSSPLHWPPLSFPLTFKAPSVSGPLPPAPTRPLCAVVSARRGATRGSAWPRPRQHTRPGARQGTATVWFIGAQAETSVQGERRQRFDIQGGCRATVLLRPSFSPSFRIIQPPSPPLPAARLSRSSSLPVLPRSACLPPPPLPLPAPLSLPPSTSCSFPPLPLHASPSFPPVTFPTPPLLILIIFTHPPSRTRPPPPPAQALLAALAPIPPSSN